MYRRQVRRRRAVLVLLVVACLVLISSHFSEGEEGPLHTAQNGVGSVLAPLQDGASRALKPFRDLVNWFDETFQARGENERLRDENRQLRADLTATEEQLAEGQAQGKVAKLAARDPLASFNVVSARVIGRSPTTWNQTLTINQGSADGLEADDAVITGDGLVGRVSAVSRGSARVTLITDQGSGVTARVLDGGPIGVVGAEVGVADDLIFDLIQGDAAVKPGAVLVTAGINDSDLPSRFPAGIPIGEAREQAAGEQELRQRVHVRPFAEIANLDFVSVLTAGQT